MGFRFFAEFVFADTTCALRGTPSKIHAIVEVTTAASDTHVKRAPFELCVLLDRSGSMAGDRLDCSKDAICLLIDELDAEDKLHFITYDDRTQVVFVDGDLRQKQSLKDQVRAVQTGGSTNISSGLVEAGLVMGLAPRGTFFKRATAPTTRSGRRLSNAPAPAAHDAKEGFEAHVVAAPSKLAKRIFMFSDGQANKGLQNHADLASLAAEINAAGASISTFGLGKDFNEDIMTAVARSGAGLFAFIESSKRIPDAVSEALGGLKSLVGTNCKLELVGVQGLSTVAKVYDHASHVAELHDLKYANTVQIVAECQVDACDAVPVADNATTLLWTLTYVDAASMELAKLTGYITCRYTREPTAVEKNTDAAAVVLQLQAAELDRQLLCQLDSGNRDEAIKIKHTQVAMMEESARLAPRNAFVQTKLAAAKKNARLLETETDSRRARKNVQYEGYLARRNSAASIQQLQQHVDNDDEPDPASIPSPVRHASRSPSPTSRAPRAPAPAVASPPQPPAQAAPNEPPTGILGKIRRLSIGRK